MQIQVRINEEGALRNQRYAFTDKYTVISELMQNARRAGARRIEISYEENSRILRVVDDGCGIDDFQKLLTFNESGWDKDTCREERPFGIGFSKCLYSASRCIVVSGNRKVDFLTEEALNRKPVDVLDVEHPAHTVIELHDVQLPDLKSRLQTMCSGFPVPIWYNGTELARTHALGHLPFVSADIGYVFLSGTPDGKHASDTLVFLQGFCVMRPSYFDATRVNVVHLDSKEFVARLPDRDKLIDEEDQRKRIDACLKSLWRRVLLEAKGRMESEAFVDTFFHAMRWWGHLDLLNDVPTLPTCLCERIVGYPMQVGYQDRDYLEPVRISPRRRDIEEGKVQLIDLDGVNSENAAHWMFARAKACVVMAASSLHHGHWVQPYVRDLEREAVRVEAVGEHSRAFLDGRWVGLQVILCNVVSVTVGGERVEITEDGVYANDALFIPAGESSGESVRQASDFIDEHDHFLDADLDADRDALAGLIGRLRSTDPKATLHSLLPELALENYPLLQGRSFRLSIGRERGEHAVELIT